MKPVVVLLSIMLFAGAGICQPGHAVKKSLASVETRNDLRKFYHAYNVDGMFVLYDPQKRHYIFYNKALYTQPETPASTFNIVNTLIALQEGIIKDSNSIMKWNGRKYHNPQASQDLDLKTAFKNNIDWYFWRLRLREGERTKYWLKKFDYGTGNMPAYVDSFIANTKGVDSFWVVSPALKITPEQQLDFIQRFYYIQLPFSKRNIDLVKRLMLDKEGVGYKLYGKRGSYTLNTESKYIGWFTGYVQVNNNVYFFINYIQSPDLHHPSLVNAQKEIVYKILQELKITD